MKKTISVLAVILLFVVITNTSALPILHNGMRINIKSNVSGYNLSFSRFDSERKIWAQGPYYDPIEAEFILIDNFDGTYSFQNPVENAYVCADYNFSPPYLVLNRSAIGEWEKFRIIDLGNNNFALQSSNNTYVCNDQDLRPTALVANRTEIGPWETFQMQVITFGMPNKLNYGTWAISYATSSCNATFLDQSFNTRDAFVNTLSSNISALYPAWSIFSNWTCRYDEGAASLASFQAPNKDACEFVLFVGHGAYYPYNPSTYEGNANCPLFLNNTTCQPSWNTFTLGGNSTKWAIFDACEVLKNRNPSAYTSIFNGAHAIFGFQSNGFQWDKKSDWWECLWNGCKYTHSWDKERYFLNNWFAGQDMWTSWSNAVSQHYNDSKKGYFHLSVPGFEYAMVQVWGQALDNNGNWQNVYGGYENFTNIYKKQTPRYNTPGWNYGGITYISTVIGTPQYD